MNTIAEVCKDSISFEYRYINRLILNAYIPTLRTPGAMGYFIRELRGKPILGGLVFKELTDQFVARIRTLAAAKRLSIVHVTGKQRPGDADEAALARACPTCEFREIHLRPAGFGDTLCTSGRGIRGRRSMERAVTPSGTEFFPSAGPPIPKRIFYRAD